MRCTCVIDVDYKPNASKAPFIRQCSLCSSAPDLLDACKAMVGLADQHWGDTDDSELHDMLEAAIKKAEGS